MVCLGIPAWRGPSFTNAEGAGEAIGGDGACPACPPCTASDLASLIHIIARDPSLYVPVGGVLAAAAVVGVLVGALLFSTKSSAPPLPAAEKPKSAEDVANGNSLFLSAMSPASLPTLVALPVAAAASSLTSELWSTALVSCCVPHRVSLWLEVFCCPFCPSPQFRRRAQSQLFALMLTAVGCRCFGPGGARKKYFGVGDKDSSRV